MLTDEKLEKRKRKYFPQDMIISEWALLEKETRNLIEYPVNSTDDLIMFLEKWSELLCMLYHEYEWRFIQMTLHVDKEEYKENYNKFVAEIWEPFRSLHFQLQKKYYNCALRKELPEQRFAALDQSFTNQIELFREENTTLKTKESELPTQYQAMMSTMTVKFRGEEKTFQQMAFFLKNNDRNIREQAWRARFDRFLQDTDKFDRLFDELKIIRSQIAKNAGFDNYRDYRHREMERYSYTPDDLYLFHEAVEMEVLPFVREMHETRRRKLGADMLRPWDLAVDLDGKILKPFSTADELIEKAVHVLGKIKPEYGLQLNRMYNTGLLDLENRKGKAPGGYNAPLPEYGASFIFGNIVGLHHDIEMIFHEAGHAMHTKSVVDEPLFFYRTYPHEVSELASKSMELFTMDHWDDIYPDEQDLKKAKRDQLEGTLTGLPFMMLIDAFQHWVYTQPDHTPDERKKYYSKLIDRFSAPAGVDWTGLEKQKQISWMLIYHVFGMPFYYIEYAITQLGALAIYKHYKENRENALTQYEAFLKLGGSRSVKEIYQTAGIQFDWSREYIRDLVQFVKSELKKLE